MGSSILASLSEAGGNDLRHLVNGPLPPHSLNNADRVGTRPARSLMQVDGPFFPAAFSLDPSSFQQLAAFRFHVADSSDSNRERASRIGLPTPFLAVESLEPDDPVGRALLVSSLCRGQEKRTMRE